MKLEPIINFMHYVQYRVMMSDICDSVSFGANDEEGFMDVRFKCKERIIPTGGLTFTSYIMRCIDYDTMFSADFDYEEWANDMVDKVEELLNKKEN